MKKPLHKTMTLSVVPRTGFEPVTLGLEVLCSIQLSYRGAYCQEGHVPPLVFGVNPKDSLLPLKPTLRAGTSWA